MTPREMTEEIRKVQELCQQWENQVTGEDSLRPRWVRGFSLLYGIIGWGVVLGILAILQRISWQSPLPAKAALVVAVVMALLWIAYSVVASGVEIYTMGKRARELALPFSGFDVREQEANLMFERSLAQFPEAVLKQVASSMEMQAKKAENARSMIVGVVTLASGVFGFLLWPGSPLRLGLAQRVPESWIGWLQLWMLMALVGGLLAIGAGWIRIIRCGNRALTIRRVMDLRSDLLAIEDGNTDNVTR